MLKNSIHANPQMWVKLYGDQLYQYALPRVNDLIIAEDLVQETFLSALKGLDGYKGDASEKNWLFAILKNKIIDHYRKRATEQTVLTITETGGIEEELFNEEGHWMENRTPNDWSNAENPVERKEIQRIILWCKDHLKLVQQQVFTLRYLEDLDSDAICKVLNISSSNYWVLIHRARLQMRDCVEKNWFQK